MQGITKKSINVSDWYNDVIMAAKLAEHGPAKGSMIIRPYGYAIWERLQKIVDHKIKALGVDNCSFPILIPYSFLEKEKAHVKGFSPELAVVTHAGGEKLVDPLVVRPTSETIMYDAFSRWIQSFRDLPLKVNQWNSVVRWEKRPYLFLRGSEFLWQEGHTAHATSEEAQQMVEDALKEYIDIYQNYFGVYGYPGRKSSSETFAGADLTYTYEILSPEGKVIQGATSHNLGQNFAKPFKVQFQDAEGKMQYVWQTSWAISTRSIGALILVHGDDTGLVIPPALAEVQVVIVPIISKDSNAAGIKDLAMQAYKLLESHDLRVRLDDSDQSVGRKFNLHELQGVPIRIEVGTSELREQKLTLVPRIDLEVGRPSVNLTDLSEKVEEILNQIQTSLLARSREYTEQNTREANTYEEFKNIMSTTRGFIKAFWCEDENCEIKIKEETKATTRCLPLDAPDYPDETCVYCGKPAKHRWLFAQSY